MFIIVAAAALIGTMVAGGVATQDRHEPRQAYEREAYSQPGTDTVESCVWVAGKNGQMLEDCRRQGTRVRRIR